MLMASPFEKGVRAKSAESGSENDEKITGSIGAQALTCLQKHVFPC